MKKKNPLQQFIDIVLERDKEQNLSNASKTLTEKLQRELNTSLKAFLYRNFAQKQAKILRILRKAYLDYGSKGFLKNNKGLKGWRLNELKPVFRKQLRERINFTLNLVKTQDTQRMSILQSRFLGWLSGQDSEATKKPNLRESLKVEKLIRKNDKHYNMILKDQTRKMISNFDNIVAEHYKALGFFWKTRRDNRVVGNPSGKNPKGNEAHGDHYDREGKFYFYKDNWAVRQGLINKSSKDFHWAEFEDGLPGQPINCRCYAYNIYELEDIPKTLLSKKGEAYLESLDS